jgi:hypothetical protein
MGWSEAPFYTPEPFSNHNGGSHTHWHIHHARILILSATRTNLVKHGGTYTPFTIILPQLFFGCPMESESNERDLKLSTAGEDYQSGPAGT